MNYVRSNDRTSNEHYPPPLTLFFNNVIYISRMDASNTYERVQYLLDFLQKFPTRNQLIVYLSENVCPQGKSAGVATCDLNHEGVINIQFHHGFHPNDHSKLLTNVTDDNPAAQSLRTMKIVYEDVSKIQPKCNVAEIIPSFLDYVSAVAIPVSSRRSYGFTFNSKINYTQEYKNYFECVRSVLAYWEMINENIYTKKAFNRELVDQELSQRQMLILDLIKENRTNSAIAALLGYSESLIRQETIAIYRKLGVEGRREIKKSLAS